MKIKSTVPDRKAQADSSGRSAPHHALDWLRAAIGISAVTAIVLGIWLIAMTASAGVRESQPTLKTDEVSPSSFMALDQAQINSGAQVAAAPRPAAQVAATESPTPSLAADEVLLEITPIPEASGWLRSNDTRNNRFGDSFLYTGVSENEIFHGAMQFDLSAVPRGAPIRAATLVMTGLDDSRLNRSSESSWQVRWLDAAVNDGWFRRTFQDIHNSAIFQTVLPALRQDDLQVGGQNSFVFDEQQLAALEKALIDEQPMLAFRIDGPDAGDDNLFAWDTGYGAASAGNRPALLIVTGPVPATPPPTPTRDYVVVTSTPTPQNVLTALVMQEAATAQATTTGTATPTPPNMVTATSTAENQATAVALGAPWVVTATPTPANQTTATVLALHATAQALTTGTWTPTPEYFITATATPTFVVITNTPTPATAAQLLAWAFAEATRVSKDGPPTPIPPGFITATPRFIVATSTPTPENGATAQAIRVLATVVALTTGTYTPAPVAITPTPTATATPGPLVAALTPTATRTPAPGMIPEELRGKIVFRSDRLRSDDLFVLDPSCLFRSGGCNENDVRLLTDPYPYLLAKDAEPLSQDGKSRVFVQLENVADAQDNIEQLPRVFVEDTDFDAIRRLSPFAGAAYDPVWSPTNNQIAFVSTDPGNDEIYVINADGSGLRRLTTNSWEWDKHPTWSPDGQYILFYSNRDSGRRQLWLMKADGSEQQLISNNQYNDWDPVWIK